MDFSDFEYHKDKLPKDYSEQEKFFLGLKEKFFNEIKDSPVAQVFFQKYNPDSIAQFIESYARNKVHVTKLYEHYLGQKLKHELKYREEAEFMLDAIRQKKLFDLQVQWRAESITIKEVEFYYDFNFWSDHVRECPFIPAITPREVAVIKEFMVSDSYIDMSDFYHYDWQNYDYLSQKDEEDDLVYPNEWYEFYDERMVTGSLLLLPDKRGVKEMYYEDLGRKEYLQEREERIKSQNNTYIAPAPSLYANATESIEFARIFEIDKHFLELFELYYEDDIVPKPKHDIERDEIDDAIDVLEEAPFPFYIPGNKDWREAIILSARNYVNYCISDELDSVYEEYRMLNDLGITRGVSKEELKNEYQKDTAVHMLRGFILRGRELSGEPADFNF